MITACSKEGIPFSLPRRLPYTPTSIERKRHFFVVAQSGVAFYSSTVIVPSDLSAQNIPLEGTIDV
jgi:hypothetical protein